MSEPTTIPAAVAEFNARFKTQFNWPLLNSTLATMAMHARNNNREDIAAKLEKLIPAAKVKP